MSKFKKIANHLSFKNFHNFYFQLAYTFGWLTGHFPVPYPCKLSANKFAIIFSWILLIFLFCNELWILLSTSTAENPIIKNSHSVFGTIFYVGISVIYYLTDALRRLNSLIYFQTILKLCKFCQLGKYALRSEVPINGRNSIFIMMGFCISSLILVERIFTNSQTYFNEPRPLAWEFGFYVGMSFLAHDTFIIFSMFYCLSITVLLGVRLASEFDLQTIRMVDNMQSLAYLRQSIPNTKKTSDNQRIQIISLVNVSYAEDLEEIKCSLEQYKTGLGGFMLLLLFEYTFYTVHFITDMFSTNVYYKSKFTDVVSLVESMAVIFLVLSLGSYMTSTVQNCREKLQLELYRLKQNDFYHKPEIKNTYYNLKMICRWDWHLTGKDVFRINYGLIPGIFGTIMTYLIFGLQLKMTENSTQ